MSKKFFKGGERYHGYPVYVLLAIFTILLGYKLINDLFIRPTRNDSDILISVVIALLLGLLWWFLFRIQLKIKIGKQFLTIRFFPAIPKRLKIQQKEVSLIKFFKASEHSLWAGWTVHFSKNDTFINLGGNSGMFIEMKNGHKYFIFSRILYENHERLQKEFIKSGWKIDKENAQKD